MYHHLTSSVRQSCSGVEWVGSGWGGVKHSWGGRLMTNHWSCYLLVSPTKAFGNQDPVILTGHWFPQQNTLQHSNAVHYDFSVCRWSRWLVAKLAVDSAPPPHPAPTPPSPPTVIY